MTLGDFELVRTLGVGSFGRVKYGKYKGDGNMYAVKFMKKHEIIKLKQVARGSYFQTRQIQLTSQLCGIWRKEI